MRLKLQEVSVILSACLCHSMTYIPTLHTALFSFPLSSLRPQRVNHIKTLGEGGQLPAVNSRTARMSWFRTKLNVDGGWEGGVIVTHHITYVWLEGCSMLCILD